MVNIGARATAMPAGAVPPKTNLDAGEYSLEIVDRYLNNEYDEFTPEGVVTYLPCVLTGIIDIENGVFTRQVLPFAEGDPVYVTVKYPDGSVKDHQVKDMPELLGKVGQMLRFVFGAPTVEYSFPVMPATLAVGTVITAKVA